MIFIRTDRHVDAESFLSTNRVNAKHLIIVVSGALETTQSTLFGFNFCLTVAESRKKPAENSVFVDRKVDVTIKATVLYDPS
jgi:hypothetical protein